eukprot:648639-Hanusia_phi.AAC.1
MAAAKVRLISPRAGPGPGSPAAVRIWADSESGHCGSEPGEARTVLRYEKPPGKTERSLGVYQCDPGHPQRESESFKSQNRRLTI